MSNRWYTDHTVFIELMFVFFSEALSANDEPEFLYYMNDGVYGSFANKLQCEDSIWMPLAHKVNISLFLLKTI